MDRNTITGFILIALLLMLWSYLNSPSDEEIQRQRALQDSVRLEMEQSLPSPAATEVEPVVSDTLTTEETAISDSLRLLLSQAEFGPFAPAASGKEEVIRLENDLIAVDINTRGGHVVRVMLKKYDRVIIAEDRSELKVPVYLLDAPENDFNYSLPVPDARGGVVNTRDLFFSPSLQGNTLRLKAATTTGGYFEKVYTVKDGVYDLDYSLNFEGLDRVVDIQRGQVELQWTNYLNKIERNDSYERNYGSTVYFKEETRSPSYCSCGSNSEENLKRPVEWVSHSNQFFNTTLLPERSFSSADVFNDILTEDSEYLKRLRSNIVLPVNAPGSETIAMKFYMGPNDFGILRSYNAELEYIIPFGWSIFGTVNRYVIRPLFIFLQSFIPSAGLVIITLTLLVRIVLFPLTFKMLKSQAKMGALKPEMEAIREKHAKDQQTQQVEIMKLYRETGVNPLGGCFPMLLQLPIWIALYRFFPASIEFRQEGFLWATDLSTYDAFMYLPFNIPFYGSHVSLFTLLWAISTVIYSYYNSRHMDFSANPMMKYIQYFMPIMFLFFFNSFAAGLTAYLFFSNFINIIQMATAKYWLIDEEKIRAQLQENKKKPKKKSKFQERLESAMKEQQRIQAQKAQERKKNK